MQTRPLSEIKKYKSDELVAKLTSTVGKESAEAGISLAKESASFGLSVKEFLQLAITRDTANPELDGYELMLMKLNLPVRNDLSNGVHLQAASETFQQHAGTRALFPQVIDDVIRFAARQDQFETVAPMIANSRTINGVELLSTVIDDDSKENDTFSVAEMARIPVRTIRTSEKSVKFYKHGSAIRTSYEFSRRASIDLLIPHANRIARELERSKVKVATAVLINGDGAYGAAPVINQSSYNGASYTGYTATNGKINWTHFLYWLVERAKAGVPIDTVVMNWDGLFQWLMLFGKDASDAGVSSAETLKKVGVDVADVGMALNLFKAITPVLSSSVPAGQLIGFSKGDTLEELKEAGSDISETERAILNQTMTMTRTENTGYRLVYGDTRSIFVFKE